MRDELGFYTLNGALEILEQGANSSGWPQEFLEAAKQYIIRLYGDDSVEGPDDFESGSNWIEFYYTLDCERIGTLGLAFLDGKLSVTAHITRFDDYSGSDVVLEKLRERFPACKQEE